MKGEDIKFSGSAAKELRIDYNVVKYTLDFDRKHGIIILKKRKKRPIK